MTHEELAKHWGVSLQEVKSISDYMNAHYYLTVGQHKETKLWYGLMYEWHELPDGEKMPHLAVSSQKGFKTEKEAIQSLNQSCENWQMSLERAQLMNVPQDAYKTLIKIPESVHTHKCHIISTGRNKVHTK